MANSKTLETLTRAAALAAALAIFAAARPSASSWAQEAPATQAPVSVVVGDVVVSGNQRLQPAVVIGTSGLAPGDTIGYREINRAIRALWATGQFDDVRVEVVEDSTGAGGPVAIVLRVVERPHVSEIQFVGLEHVRANTVRDTVGLHAGQPIQRAKVAEAETMVRRLLADKGYQLRSIRHRLEEIEGRPGEYRLIFDVEEGNRVAIAEIVFEGNEAFSDSELRKVLDTKPEGFFWFRQGMYDEAKVRTDVREKLPEFYGKYGYIDFVVTGDTLIVDPESGKARLVIRVDEGPQYRLADFSINGNRQFATEDLSRYFERQVGGLLSRIGLGGSEQRERGEIFDRAAFDEATTQVRQLYRNYGYLGAQVQPVIERTTDESGTPVVRLAWEIREGQPAYVNKVSIKGNTFTHEDVIRERIFLLPGDVYNEELLIQSYQSIMGLGFFETPMPMPQMELAANGKDVDITFEVKEKQTGSFSFGTSIGGWGGLSGFLGFDHPNLFGMAKSGHLRWEYGRYSNIFEASYTDPALLGSRVSGSISLFNTNNSYNALFRFSEGEQRRTGLGLRFGVPFPLDRRFSRVFLGYTISNIEYRNFEETEGSIFNLPEALQSTVSLGLVRQTLNSPMFPTSGSRQELEATFTGGMLGGDGEFQKYKASSTWWVPVGQVGGERPGTRPIRFALGLTAEAGALVGDARNFPFERFWMGGVQWGLPLRGYDETTITPAGYLPRNAGSLNDRFGDAYLRMSAEYAIRFNDNISMSAFFDAGNVWSGPEQFNPTQLYRGAGMGLTLITPFGPLGLDLAYGFDRDEPGWKFHFKFGQGF